MIVSYTITADVALAMCAHAFLAVTAAAAAERGTRSGREGLVPLTLAEVRRLLAHLISTVRSIASIHRWSRWRLRHQHRAPYQPLPAQTPTTLSAAGVLCRLHLDREAGEFVVAS